MKRVELSEQVVEFVRSQPPESRKALRAGLRKLQREQGDIRPLESPLKDFCRLRVGGFRVIFSYSPGGKWIRCVFAERRGVVYEIFEKLLTARLLGEGGPAENPP